MKLKFKNQKFQLDAVDAVTSLFQGQEQENATFSILKTVLVPVVPFTS